MSDRWVWVERGIRSGVGIGGVGGSDTGIVVVVVAVPVSGVVGSVAEVGGSVVGSVVGRSAVGVGGSGDHGLTGSSAHVHLLAMTNAPLVHLGASISVTRSISRSVSVSTISVSIIAIP